MSFSSFVLEWKFVLPSVCIQEIMIKYLEENMCHRKQYTIEHKFESVTGTIQLLSEIFLDSDFCYNYLHTQVTLNWLPYA